MGWDQAYIWSFSFPIFSGLNLNDSSSFTRWFCDFSITNNCSLQALLSISEQTVPKAGRASLLAAFKGPAQREMSEDSRVQTHKALPRHVGALDALKNGHFPLTPSVLLLGRPGGSDHPLSITSSQPGKELGQLSPQHLLLSAAGVTLKRGSWKSSPCGCAGSEQTG